MPVGAELRENQRRTGGVSEERVRREDCRRRKGPRLQGRSAGAPTCPPGAPRRKCRRADAEAQMPAPATRKLAAWIQPKSPSESELMGCRAALYPGRAAPSMRKMTMKRSGPTAPHTRESPGSSALSRVNLRARRSRAASARGQRRRLPPGSFPGPWPPGPWPSPALPPVTTRVHRCQACCPGQRRVAVPDDRAVLPRMQPLLRAGTQLLPRPFHPRRTGMRGSCRARRRPRAGGSPRLDAPGAARHHRSVKADSLRWRALPCTPAPAGQPVGTALPRGGRSRGGPGPGDTSPPPALPAGRR